MQILITCEHTGQLIQVNDFYDVGGLQEEDFKQICLESYKDAVNQGRTLSIDYMDNPTIVGCIGIDFDLMKNWICKRSGKAIACNISDCSWYTDKLKHDTMIDKKQITEKMWADRAFIIAAVSCDLIDFIRENHEDS